MTALAPDLRRQRIPDHPANRLIAVAGKPQGRPVQRLAQSQGEKLVSHARKPCANKVNSGLQILENAVFPLRQPDAIF